MLIYLHEPCQKDNVTEALKTCYDPGGVNPVLNGTAIFDQKTLWKMRTKFKKDKMFS